MMNEKIKEEKASPSEMVGPEGAVKYSKEDVVLMSKLRNMFPSEIVDIAFETMKDLEAVRAENERAILLLDYIAEDCGDDYIDAIVEEIKEEEERRASRFPAETRARGTYIKDVVGELIGEENVEEWLDTPIPSLLNFTPAELMRYGKIELVEELVDSYNDPSYS